MQSKYYLIAFLVSFSILFFINSCKKNPNFSIIPFIEFQKFNKDTIIAESFTDTIVVSLNFKDGDGNIGFDYVSSDSCDLNSVTATNSCLFHPTWSLFLIDDRDSSLRTFRMPYIESNKQNPSIEGVIDIEVYNLEIKKGLNINCGTLGVGAIDTVVFHAIMKDRAGNFSNVATLPEFYIKCQ